MPTNKEYHNNELRRYLCKIDGINKQSVADKREAKASLLDCWNNFPHVFGERIQWLLNGSYGYGEMVTALKAADNKHPRFNRVAALSQLIALNEWQCPHTVTVAAFKSLSPAQQSVVSAVVQKELEYFDSHREEFEPKGEV